MCRVIETDNGSGAHERRHAEEDVESTNRLSYAPNVASLTQLINKTMDLLEKDNRVNDVDFVVPSKSWFSLQLSPSYHL